MVQLTFQNVRSTSHKNYYAHANVCTQSKPCGLVVQISSACGEWKRKIKKVTVLNGGCFNIVRAHCDEPLCFSPMSQRRGTDQSSQPLLCLAHQTNAASALRGSTTAPCSAGYFRSCTETRSSQSTTAWSSKSTCCWTEKG